MSDYVSRAEILIRKAPEEVWQTLTATGSNPEIMFGAEIVTDWQVGHPISWKGSFKGTDYEDRGTILAFDEPNALSMTHFSPMTGQPDLPENYHTVSYSLEKVAEGTRVALTQDKNPTMEAAAHSEENWMLALKGLRSVVEGTLVDD
ncbi:MAG: ATPase [Subtercola sp.]|nr:ATPase [Subtercola sp.]